MNWLQKISINQHKAGFFFVDGKFFYFPDLHTDWLSRTLSIPTEYAGMLRYAIPRGRAIADDWGWSPVLIEASAVLEPYKSQIAQDLNLTQADRPKWDFNDRHYQVPTQESIEQQILEVYQDMPDDHAIQACSAFVPNIKNVVARYKSFNPYSNAV